MVPNGKLPLWSLMAGSNAIHQEYMKFYKQKIQDQKNESFPKNSTKIS